MATFGTVRLPDDAGNTGKLEDHVVVDTDKYREVIAIGDPNTRAAVGAVQTTDPAGTEYGPVVRDTKTPAIAASVASLDGKTVAVNTGAVVIASSVLPAGAATAAKQDTEIASLAAIDTSTAAINTKTPALGQAAMAASVPVVIATNQSAVPFSAASLPLPTGASTSANQTTQITAEQAIQVAVEIMDDWDESDRAKVNPIVGQAGVQGASGTVSANTQRVVLATDVPLPVGTNSIGDIRSITTSVTPGTAAANLGKPEDGPHTTGDVGVMALAVANEANANFGADGDYTPLGTDREGSQRAIGNRAHDAVDSGNPVKIGGVAIAFGSNPAAVAAADRTNLYANRAGIQFVLGGHPNTITLEAAYTAAQTDTAIVTVSGGSKIVVTAIEAIVDAATSVNVNFRVGFAAATTPTTTGVVLSHPGILALSGSGIGKGDGGAVLGVGADGEDLRITCTVPTSGSLRVIVTYFTIES